MADELTRRRMLGYGIGSIGTGIFGAAPGLLLLIFLTDTLGVPAGWAGLILLVPKAGTSCSTRWSEPGPTGTPAAAAGGRRTC